VTFSPTGDVEVVEQEIDAKELPKKVRAAVDDKYPKVSFTKVEEISKASGRKYSRTDRDESLLLRGSVLALATIVSASLGRVVA
jgi:hypothetical protein